MPVEVLLAGGGTGTQQQGCCSQSEGKQAFQRDRASAQSVWRMTLGCMGEMVGASDPVVATPGVAG